MEFDHVTWTGPAIDDFDLIEKLPNDLIALLRQINGFIQYEGGLHIRGASRAPAWHSLRAAWLEETAFHRLYPDVKETDIPFAEDSLGDQFLLRAGLVWQLSGETGDMESLGVTLGQFFEEVQADAVEYLGLHPLLQFQEEGRGLVPGQLLASYPPFCTEQSNEGVTLAAIPAEERHQFLASFAAQIRELPDGAEISIELED